LTEYYPPQPYPAPPYRQRPTGITLLAILNILIGIALILVALATFMAISMVDDPVFHEALVDANTPEWFMEQVPILLGTIGIFSMVFGTLALIVSFGFFKGKGWSWYLAIAYGFLTVTVTIISTLISGGIMEFLTLGISIVIPILIIVYLFQPHVKAWFSL